MKREEPTTPVEEYPSFLPNVGEIVHRLRRQRGMSLTDLAKVTGLSASFIGSLERGETDISLRNLARVADAFGHDVGSLLGYTIRRPTPVLLPPETHLVVDRGPGVHYEVIRVPGFDLELVVATCDPNAYSDEIAHEGMDIFFVTQGQLTLVYDGRPYVLDAGSCAVYAGGHPHSFRNETSSPASMVCVVTETVY